jgi:hypothetical protein
LAEYHEIPKEMAEEEWHFIVRQLEACYKSARFLQKLAHMVQAGTITAEALYICYYEEVTDGLLEKLELLIRWVGTGLDLVANYDSYELARIYSSLTALFEQLNNVHEKYGADLEAEGFKLQYDKFRAKTNSFINNPERYSVLSDDYIDCGVDIKTDMVK